jgi:hypothetical protein
MNKKLTLPHGFEAPISISEEQFYLEPLAPKHNDIDYDAWHSSVTELQGIFGPGNEWPRENYSKEQNLEDLERHYQEFVDKYAFAYTILNPDKEQCIGCLYIRPTTVAAFETHVDFWFRSSYKHLEEPFFQWLKAWLKSNWGFSAIAFPGREIAWEEYNELITKVG